jgi:thiol-disulfide isomerase/thioredoxin
VNIDSSFERQTPDAVRQRDSFSVSTADFAARLLLPLHFFIAPTAAKRMPLACLLAAARCAVVELDDFNLEDHLNGSLPVFVHFYSPYCRPCLDAAPAFSQAAKLFADVTFGKADCAAEPALCRARNLSKYPTFRLYPPAGARSVDFRGAGGADAFADFVEHHTLARSSRPASPLADLNPVNLERLTRGCGMALFYERSEELSGPAAGALRAAARIFASDANVTIGAWNCLKFPELCRQLGLARYPSPVVSVRGGWSRYRGSHALEAVVECVNLWCGTERTPGGLLGDRAGVVEEASALVPQFLAARDAAAVVARARALPAAALYVKAMERYLEVGPARMAEDIAYMERMIGARKGSMAALDGMKRRCNVYRLFLEKPGGSKEESESVESDRNRPSEEEHGTAL